MVERVAVLTGYETDLARHALGLPNKRRRSYRNNFVCGPGHTDFLAWEGMAGVGLANKRKWSLIPETESVYSLTRAGAEAALMPGESLDPEDFPEPHPVDAGKARGQTEPPQSEIVP